MDSDLEWLKEHWLELAKEALEVSDALESDNAKDIVIHYLKFASLNHQIAHRMKSHAEKKMNQ